MAAFKPSYGARTDWSMRLNGSVVQLENKFVYCEDIQNPVDAARVELVDAYNTAEHAYYDNGEEEDDMVTMVRTREAIQAYDRNRVAELPDNFTCRVSTYDANGIKARRKKTVDVRDLDMSIFHVGFTNSDEKKAGKGRAHATYVSRMPYRQNK